MPGYGGGLSRRNISVMTTSVMRFVPGDTAGTRVETHAHGKGYYFSMNLNVKRICLPIRYGTLILLQIACLGAA